jgi:hypothetical protein
MQWMRRLRGGDGGAKDINIPKTTPQRDEIPDKYCQLGILPVQSPVNISNAMVNHPLLDPGCLILPLDREEDTEKTTSPPTRARLVSLRGNPDVWHGHNLPLLESLAITSDIVVLTVTTTTMDTPSSCTTAVITPDMANAVQSGWQRRMAQGLTPGQLWIIRMAEPNNENDNRSYIPWKGWVDEMVTQEWTNKLFSNTTLCDDWWFGEGISEYRQALDDLTVSKLSSTRVASPLVPMDGIPSLLHHVYTTFSGKDAALLFWEAKETPTATKLPRNVYDDDDDSMKYSDEVDTNDNESRMISLNQYNAIQEKLDEYWLTATEQGPNLPPDLVKLLPAAAAAADDDDDKASSKTPHDFLIPLLEQHATILQDYYGRLYESLMTSDRGGTEVMQSMLQQYQMSAERVMKHLGLNATTTSIYRQNFQSLEKDLEEINESWQGMSEVMLEDDESREQGPANAIHNWLPPRFRKLALQTLLLGVNYLQGWLAWQGLQRAALEREQTLPKFPLF